MKLTFTYLSVLFFVTGALAQSTVSGTVIDEEGPLIGVNILVKGKGTGTVTDFDGKYLLEELSPSDVLIFSYTGYATQEVAVGDQSTIDVTMKPNVESLAEITVVGYGTRKKSNVVGSVASVDVDETTLVPTTNVSEMLRGRAAGVQVNLADARPGGTSNIVIRGNVSVAPDGNGPLIIVDGLPFDNLNDVAPDDIASIEILKDASATAIYGSRASNGVILVTTKSGQVGKTKIDYHGFTTTQSITRNFNLYDGQQFIDLRREANRIRATGEYLRDENIFTPAELQAIENQEFVDWEDLILDDALLQNHALSLSTGTERTRVFSSLNYFTQDGIIPGSTYDRAAFKLNLDQQISDKLKMKAIVNYQSANQERETGGLSFTIITPLAQPFDSQGNLQKFYLGAGNTAVNPLWDQRESSDESKINLVDVNLNFTYNFTDNFYYTLNTYLRNRNTNRGLYRTSLHSGGDEGIDGFALISNTLFRQSLIENIVGYEPDLGPKHGLDFTFVHAFDERRNEYTQTDKSGFANDALGFSGNATTLLNNFRSVSQRRLLSFLGRMRYSYLDRYLLEVTARSDGSSVFAENNKWGFFPAASAAWKIHLEPWMANQTAVDELKFRVSYGATGNQGINSLESLGRADNTPYVFGGVPVAGAVASSRLPNPNLQWETTATFNVGLDFRLFGNFLEGTVEYYNAKTTDLLLDRAVSGTTGFDVTRFNVGEIENRGVELSLLANLVRSNTGFRWSVGTMFASNRNRILALTGEVDDEGNPIDITDSFGRRLSIGQSINNIWLPLYDGIWQEGENIADSGTPLAQPGDIRVIDQDGNGQIDNRDNVFINTDPDWYGSVNTNISYKGFELFADFYIVQGATRLNQVLANGELWKGAINGIRTKYYTPEFPSTSYPRPKPDTHVHLFPFAVRDASYVRLRTLSIGYNLPQATLQKVRISNAKVYVTGTNIWTYTKFPSYSPEQNLVSDGTNVFPETRNVTVGLKIGF
jgi:TonB-linked SusC/RagA family outer membrane protein